MGASGVGLSAEKGRMTKETVERFQSAGYRVNAWTIDDLALAREYQGLGVDSITTNRPALIRNLLTSDSADDPVQRDELTAEAFLLALFLPATFFLVEAVLAAFFSGWPRPWPRRSSCRTPFPNPSNTCRLHPRGRSSRKSTFQEISASLEPRRRSTRSARGALIFYS